MGGPREATVEFLGVGYQELLLVLVLMLVIVGPERLPQVAYQIGRAVRQMQRYARTVRDEFGDEFGAIQEQYDAVRGEMSTARTEFRRQQQEFAGEVQDATKSIEQAVPDELKNRGNVIPINALPPRAAVAPSPSTPADTSVLAAAPAATAIETPVAPANVDAPPASDKPPLVF